MGVTTGDLRRSVLNRENRQFLVDEQLVLVSPNDPEAGFHVAKAMERNKLIYVLADAALVVEATYGSGGTWQGATEQLEKNKKPDTKGRHVPVFTRSTGEIGSGLEGLQQQGAILWPEPANADEFRDTMMEAANKTAILPTNLGFSLEFGNEQNIVAEAQSSYEDEPNPGTAKIPSTETHGEQQVSTADSLFAHVEELIEGLGSPITETVVAERLHVTKAQAKAWLDRLSDEGKYLKKNRPVRYERTQISMQTLLDNGEE